MKILFVTHAAFESPGSIYTWAQKNNYETQIVKPYDGDNLANIGNYDFLIVMGGPQSPLAMDKAPYLKDEIKLIQKTLEQNKPILGICLGAQLIGEALGAKTERSPNREIGIYPIDLLPEAKEDPIFKTFPARFDVMHWHNDMPGLPKDGTLIAKSAGCPRQIIRYKEKVYGFQCHFELTQELVSGMVAHCSKDLQSGTYVRTKEELVKGNYSEINTKLDKILNLIV